MTSTQQPNITFNATAPTRPQCSWIVTTQDYKDANWLAGNRFYLQLAVALVGLIIVFSVYGKRMLKGSPYYYICVLTLADTSYIIMDTLAHKLQFGVMGYDWQNLGCGFMEYMFHNTQMFAVGVLVFMMFERMLLTLNPIKFQNSFTVKRTAIALGVLAICVCGINTPYIWVNRSKRYFSARHKEYFWACAYDTAETSQVAVLTVINIKLYGFFFVPMAILLICSIITAVKITRIAKSGQDAETGDKGQGQHKGRGRLFDKTQGHLKDITTQVLTVSIFFVVLAFPYAVSFVPGSPVGRDGEYCASMLLRYVVTEVAKFLYDCQHCLNGYLYCMSSRVFREQLVIIWKCKKDKKKQEDVSETKFTEMPTFSETVDETGTMANGTHK